jgi:hypothetical protein
VTRWWSTRAALLAEITRLRALLAEHERTVTTGGPPLPCQPLGAWKPETTTPPSADDTTAPPLTRRTR